MSIATSFPYSAQPPVEGHAVSGDTPGASPAFPEASACANTVVLVDPAACAPWLLKRAGFLKEEDASLRILGIGSECGIAEIFTATGAVSDAPPRQPLPMPNVCVRDVVRLPALLLRRPLALRSVVGYLLRGGRFLRMLSLLQVLRQLDTDHVHVLAGGESASLAAAATELLGISWSLSLDGQTSERLSPSLFHRWLRRCEFTVAGSENVRRHLQDRVGVSADRIHCVPPGVDCNFYQAGTTQRTVGEVRVRLVATLEAASDRALDTLVDVVARLNASGYSTGCRLLGVDGRVEELVEKARRRGISGLLQISPADDPAQLRTLLRSADLFLVLQQAHATDLPMTVLEAMSCEVPVVAAADGSFAGVLRHGVDGVLTRMDDATALAETVARLADDRLVRQRIGCAGRRTVLGAYSGRGTAATLRALFSPAAPAAMAPRPEIAA